MYTAPRRPPGVHSTCILISEDDMNSRVFLKKVVLDLVAFKDMIQLSIRSAKSVDVWDSPHYLGS